MYLTDRVTIGAVRRTAGGYLVADAKVARTGVQHYTGAELGRPDRNIVRLYRPEEEVFATDAMRSYAYRPVTIEHPAKMVDATTWKGVATGQTGAEVVRDGQFVRVPLVLMDAAAIAAYESGKRELSMGYTSEIVFQDGITNDGEHYDAIQTNLRMNHLALVEKARGGPELRIGDGRSPDDNRSCADTLHKEHHNMNEQPTRTILVDGLSVTTTDAGAQAIAKLQSQLTDAAAAAQKTLDDHNAVIAAKDAAIAKVEAERDSLKAKVLSDADLDARVRARAQLVSDAVAIHDADYSGKSDNDIRKAAVVGRLGAEVVDGKSEAYIEARFDILAKDGKTDPVNRVLRDGVHSPATPIRDNGYSASIDSLDYRNRNRKEA